MIVSDVHLRAADAPDARAFHRFLEAVPELGSHLVLNGDLFEFWFEYRRVVPRFAFPTLAALDRLRATGVRLTVTGGNHDRWGGPFWREQLGARFHPEGTRLVLAGHPAFVAHGDGLTDGHPGARLLHWLTGRRLTRTVFRWIHPDLGYPLIEWGAGRLADSTRTADVLAAAAEAQRAWARRLLQRQPDLALVVLSHTHRPALDQVEPGRWYLNPGAWIAGHRYAVVTEDGPALRRFPSGRD